MVGTRGAEFRQAGRIYAVRKLEHTIGRVRSFYGNFGAQIGNWHASYGRGGFRSVGLKFINNAIVATSAQQMLVELPGFDYIVPT